MKGYLALKICCKAAIDFEFCGSIQEELDRKGLKCPCKNKLAPSAHLLLDFKIHFTNSYSLRPTMQYQNVILQ